MTVARSLSLLEEFTVRKIFSVNWFEKKNNYSQTQTTKCQIKDTLGICESNWLKSEFCFVLLVNCWTIAFRCDCF